MNSCPVATLDPDHRAGKAAQERLRDGRQPRERSGGSRTCCVNTASSDTGQDRSSRARAPTSVCNGRYAAATTIQPVVEQKGIRFRIDCPAEIGAIRSQQRHLREVLCNLLSNAGKFTERGEISLTVVRTVEAQSAWLYFSVSDTGIGMTPEQQARLFQRFMETDAATTLEVAGGGLGLFLVRQVVAAWSGAVRVQSQPEGGTVVTVRVRRT